MALEWLTGVASSPIKHSVMDHLSMRLEISVKQRQRRLSHTWGRSANISTLGEMHAQTEANDDDLEPQTPAPAFMMRAFRQALFGTPKAVEDDSERPARVRQLRPVSEDGPTRRASAPIPRRKSSDSARAKPQSEVVSQASPAKGILMTPGTGGNRRKTVSFGDHTERELTVDHTKRTQLRKLTKFEEKLLESRGKRDSPMASSATGPDEEETSADTSQPLSSSGKYWKDEYDSLSVKSAEQMRKLVKKEQLAKKFARIKDSTVNELECRLREEQGKVTDLEAQLQQYVDKLTQATCEATRANQEMAGRISTPRPSSLAEAYLKIDKVHEQNEALQVKMRQMQKEHDSYRAGAEEKIRRLKRTSRETTVSSRDSREASARVARTPQRRADPPSDIWADAGQGSSQVEISSLEPRDRRPRIGDSESRRPLGRRNAPNFEDSQRVLDALKAKQLELVRRPSSKERHSDDDVAASEREMSEERREAARRRLEERKKTRIPSSGSN